MTAITFDTHAYVRKLQSVGFTEAQAEAQTEILSSVFEKNLDDLASRQDLKELELSTKLEIEKVRKEIEMVRKEISDAKADLIRWMFGVAAGQAAFIIAILKLAPSH